MHDTVSSSSDEETPKSQPQKQNLLYIAAGQLFRPDRSSVTVVHGASPSAEARSREQLGYRCTLAFGPEPPNEKGTNARAACGPGDEVGEAIRTVPAARKACRPRGPGDPDNDADAEMDGTQKL